MDNSNIQAIITKYRESKIQSEAEVRSKLIVPLLEELGYAPKYRAEEFPVYGYAGMEKLKAKNADFLLFDNEEFAEHRDRTPENNEWVREHSLLVVEAKKPGKIPEELGQAQYYTMWTRAVAYIETDGEEVFGYYYNPVANDRKVLQTTVDDLSASEVLGLFTYESVSITKEKGIQFFSLAGDFDGRNSVLNTSEFEEDAFIISHPVQYFGHEEEIREVLSWLGPHKVIFVYGEGGIGKTEFCREVLIQANTKYFAVNLTECRDFGQFIRRVAGVLEIAVATDDTAVQIMKLVLNRLITVKGILYLDNFEDVMSETKTEEAERRRVLGFLRKCRSIIPGTVLVSSRKRIQCDFEKKGLELKPLDDDSAVSLFMEIWKGDKDKRIRRFVIDDLCKFPLAIILAANHMVYYASSIEELKEQWVKARETVRIEGMENERHVSVTTALSITYEEIKADENARRLWELFTLFPESINVSAADCIIPDCYSARVTLSDLSVIHKDGKKLSMLPLLREFIRDTDEYALDLPIISEKLLEYYSGLFQVDRSTEMGSEKDLRAIEVLSDALFFMDCMTSEKNAVTVGKMHTMLCDFYQDRPYEAIEVVSRTVNQAFLGDGQVNANITKYLGDLEMRTDKLEDAEKHYCEAEEVYRRIQDDLGLSNVLLAMGDLEMRIDKLEEAGKYYREAEEVYKQIHYDLGLANVQKAMGDLKLRTAKLEEAGKHYREAEEMYRRIHFDLGLANVLQSMGELELRTAKLEETEKHYREAEEVCRRIQFNLGLANVLLMMGNLEMQTAKLEEAEKHYREAEEMYRRIQFFLGLANVLRAMGNLEQRKTHHRQAIKSYEIAVYYYEKTMGKVGMAYTSAELCYCNAEEGNKEKALHYAQQVDELCESLPYESVKDYCGRKLRRAFEKLEMSRTDIRE